jgi:hypothetical protein
MTIDTNDNTAVAQQKINAGTGGGTVSFAPGNHVQRGQLTLRAGGKYISDIANRPHLTASTGYYVFGADTANPDGITVIGMWTTGSAIRIEKQGGWTQNLLLSDWLLDGTPTAEANGIRWTNGLRNSVIRRITGTFYSANGVICGVAWDGLEVSECTLGSVKGQLSEGIHLVGDYGQSTGLHLHDNTILWAHRLAIEIQGTGKCVPIDEAKGIADVVVERNRVLHATLTPNFHENDDCFGISMPFQGGTSICRWNNVDQPEQDDHCGSRIGLELASCLTLPMGVSCYGNRVNGLNNAISISWSNGAYVRDNLITNCHSGASISSAPHAGTNARIGQNDASVKLPWDFTKWPIVIGGSPMPTPTPTPAVWTAANGKALKDGVIDQATSNVANVFEFPAGSGKWFQVTTSGDVWSLPGAGAVKGDPRPTPPLLADPIVSVTVTRQSGRVEMVKP